MTTPRKKDSIYQPGFMLSFSETHLTGLYLYMTFFTTNKANKVKT